MIDISKHPCFSDVGSGAYRIHLPVSRKCNIKCNFCSRKFIAQGRPSAIPGRSAGVLTPVEALERLCRMKKQHPKIAVAGFAGPGDNLYNPETFETLSLVRRQFPGIMLCVSTNGVLLAEKLPLLLRYQVTHITVTINASTPETGAQIYAYAMNGDIRLTGEEAAAWILHRQLSGLQLACEAGLHVKVNTVFVPGVNDDDMLPLARAVGQRGADLMNIMPMIPSSTFQYRQMPLNDDLKRIRRRCQPFIRQMIHCQQCNADACGPVPCRKTSQHIFKRQDARGEAHSCV